MFWKALLQFFSTPRAIANGKNFSNISGVLIIRLKRSDSTCTRKSSKPSTPSRARVPCSVCAGMNQPKAQTMAPVRIPAMMKASGAVAGGDFHSTEYDEKADDHAPGDIGGADAVRPGFVVSVGHERGEDIAL